MAHCTAIAALPHLCKSDEHLQRQHLMPVGKGDCCESASLHYVQTSAFLSSEVDDAQGLSWLHKLAHHERHIMFVAGRGHTGQQSAGRGHSSTCCSDAPGAVRASHGHRRCGGRRSSAHPRRCCSSPGRKSRGGRVHQQQCRSAWRHSCTCLAASHAIFKWRSGKT